LVAFIGFGGPIFLHQSANRQQCNYAATKAHCPELVFSILFRNGDNELVPVVVTLGFVLSADGSGMVCLCTIGKISVRELSSLPLSHPHSPSPPSPNRLPIVLSHISLHSRHSSWLECHFFLSLTKSNNLLFLLLLSVCRLPPLAHKHLASTLCKVTSFCFILLELLESWLLVSHSRLETHFLC